MLCKIIQCCCSFKVQMSERFKKNYYNGTRFLYKLLAPRNFFGHNPFHFSIPTIAYFEFLTVFFQANNHRLPQKPKNVSNCHGFLLNARSFGKKRSLLQFLSAITNRNGEIGIWFNFSSFLKYAPFQLILFQIRSALAGSFPTKANVSQDFLMFKKTSLDTLLHPKTQISSQISSQLLLLPQKSNSFHCSNFISLEPKSTKNCLSGSFTFWIYLSFPEFSSDFWVFHKLGGSKNAHRKQAYGTMQYLP